MKLDISDLQRSMKRLASETRKAPSEIVKTSARGFIRDVVKITPPGSEGVSGTAAKKQGEAGISIGIASIMEVAPKGFLGPLEDPAAVHKRSRNPRTGRTDRRIRGARGSKALVEAAALRAYQKKALALVGLLAAGWLDAAAKLGVKLPAWVTRHGAGRGSVQVNDDGRQFSITVNNEVQFIGNVADYERRTAAAVKMQIAKMQRQSDYLLKKALRRSGF